jgi:hypothetical protein
MPTVIGALEWTRTTTPIQAQPLKLPRIPFRHEGLFEDYAAYHTSALHFCQQFFYKEGCLGVIIGRRICLTRVWMDGSPIG